MTAIVAIVHKGKTWMGGDSAATNSWGEISSVVDPKVFLKGIFIIGVAGSPRVGNLLLHKFVPPEPHTDSVSEYMVTDFVDAMRECLKNGGIASNENNVESTPAEMLVGVAGHLFSVMGWDFQVTSPACGYEAIGTGGAYALGSLFSTQKRSPQARIQLALEAAQQHMASVRGPFFIGRV